MESGTERWFLRWTIPSLVCILGTVVVGGSFLYALITVGVPAHDPTPTVAAREAMDIRIAEFIFLLGWSVVLVGVVLFGWVALVRRAHR